MNHFRTFSVLFILLFLAGAVSYAQAPAGVTGQIQQVIGTPVNSLRAPQVPHAIPPPPADRQPSTNVAITSAFKTVDVDFDGVLSAGEWDDANHWNIGYYGGTSDVQMWIKNDCKNIYLAIWSRYQTTPNSYYYQNTVQFFFDTFNGGDGSYCSFGTGCNDLETGFTIPAAAWPGFSDNAFIHGCSHYCSCYYTWWLGQSYDPMYANGTNGVSWARQTTSALGTVFEIKIDIGASKLRMPYITSTTAQLRAHVHVTFVDQMSGYGTTYGGWGNYYGQGFGQYFFGFVESAIQSYSYLDYLYLTAPPPGMGGAVQISEPILNTSNWVYHTNENIQWTTNVSADPSQVLSSATQLYGPLTPAGDMGPLVKTQANTITATPSTQAWTVTMPIVPPALASGYYDVFVKITFTGICGPTTQTYHYRILVVQPGEGYCIVWPGDVDNNLSCNMGDRGALQNYIYRANLNPLWLTGPRRFPVGRITGQSTPLDVFSWVAQPALLWQDPLGLGCYMDADGSGAVNNLDLWGTKINIGKTHTFDGQPGQAADLLPAEFGLAQNYPNPFNPTTTISYNLPEASQVTLKITDVLGREIATLVSGTVEAGAQHVEWAPAEASSGVYFYTLTAKGLKTGTEFTSMKKMFLSK